MQLCQGTHIPGAGNQDVEAESTSTKTRSIPEDPTAHDGLARASS